MPHVLRRFPAFRRLWFAQTVSQFGDWLNRIALLTLIGALGGPAAGATAVGALFGFELALRLLPSSLLGPLVGPIADRVSRRGLMIASDAARALVVLGFLAVREPEHLPLLYGLLFAQMALSLLFEAARSASVPNTVDADHLHDAYVVSSVTWSVMLTVGALAGGLLVEALGVRAVFVMDALTFLASAMLLLGLALPPMPRAGPWSWRLLGELATSWRYARSRGLLGLLATKAFWGPAGGFLVLLSLLGRERFAAEESAAVGGGLATGLLFAARGLGTGIGPVVGRHWLGSSDTALRRQCLIGFAVAAAGYAGAGFATDLAAACALVILAHAGGSMIWVSSTLLWQRRADDAFRGRLFALEFQGLTLSFAVWGLLAGTLYDATLSTATTAWVLAAGVVVCGLAWWRLVAHRFVAGA